MASPKRDVENTSPNRKWQPSSSNASPRRVEIDSPSRQLLHELNQQTVEHTRKFYQKLDEEALQREAHYLHALNAAAIEHNRVRHNAHRAQELLLLELERRKQQEEDEQVKALDRERQREIEQHLQSIEDAKRLAAKEKLAAEAKAAAEKAEQDALAQKARKDDEESLARQATAAAATAQKQQDEEQQRKQAAPTQPPEEPSKLQQQPAFQPENASQSDTSSLSNREAEHEQYLKLHKRLKEMRKQIVSESKTNPALKSRIGDMRRAVRKSVGQLTADPETRKAPLHNIRTVLSQAASIAEPTIDVSHYILPEPNKTHQYKMSGLLFYLLNIFAKSIISQFTDEAGADPKTADPIGIVGISIFAHNDYKCNGYSLISILIAKYHKVCPVLFGINGNENTEGGRRRLGWRKDPETGTWVSEQRHTERMTGLGAGYAAITLRNFQNARSINPYPPYHYWRAIASILNTPPHLATQTHCTVLRAMIENYASRFITFYGQAAVVVIRMAVVEFPAKVPKSTASSVLATLASTLGKELHIAL